MAQVFQAFFWVDSYNLYGASLPAIFSVKKQQVYFAGSGVDLLTLRFLKLAIAAFCDFEPQVQTTTLNFSSLAPEFQNIFTFWVANQEEERSRLHCSASQVPQIFLLCCTYG